VSLRAGPQTCPAEYSSKEISPTALSHCSVPDVFEVFRTSEGTDSFREYVRVGTSSRRSRNCEIDRFARGGSPDRAVPWTATTTPSGGVTYELLNREPIHDVLDLISEAESFRTEFTTIRPHEALSRNRPREVPRGLADPTIPTVQTAVILPTP
jgi:hypothetical protein